MWSHDRPRYTSGPLPDSVKQDIERSNWLDFACIILALAGCFNVIDGIAAIRDSSYVANQVLFANLHAWGWFFLAWGVLQLFAAAAAFRGASWGVILAILVAFFNAIGQLSSAATNPVWSVTILALDVIVIYGLVTSGVLGSARRS